MLGQQGIRFPLPPYTRGDKNVYEEQELNQSLAPLLANSLTTRPWLLGLECNECIELRCVQLKLNAPAVSSFAPERKKIKQLGACYRLDTSIDYFCLAVYDTCLVLLRRGLFLDIELPKISPRQRLLELTPKGLVSSQLI